MLNQYILLEDIIYAGIEYLSRKINTLPEKEVLDMKTEEFNKLGSDFQDSWNNQYWQFYESIRGGFKNQDNPIKSTEKIAQLQELAIVMNTSSTEEKKEESKALEEVDELSRKFKPKDSLDPVAKKCCACFIM